MVLMEPRVQLVSQDQLVPLVNKGSQVNLALVVLLDLRDNMANKVRLANQVMMPLMETMATMELQAELGQVAQLDLQEHQVALDNQEKWDCKVLVDQLEKRERKVYFLYMIKNDKLVRASVYMCI